MGEVTALRSLRRNVGSAMLGSLSYTLSQFVMLLAVVRLTDPAQVGQYALALAIAAPVFVLAGLKMRHVQATDAVGAHRPGEYVAVRMTTSAFALMACLTIGWVTARDVEFFVLLSAVSLFKAIEAHVDLLYGIMQRRERMDLIAHSMMARGLLGASLFWGVLWFSGSVALAVSAVTGMTLAFVFRESRTIQKFGVSSAPDFSGRRLLSLVLLALPLGISVSVGSLTTNMPRYSLGALEGTASVGIFATIAYVLVAASLVGGSAVEAAMPRLADYHAQHNWPAFRRLTHQLAIFGLCLGLTGTLLAWFWGRPILTLLFGEVYGKANEVLVILMIAATLQYTSLAVGAAVYGMRLFKVQVPINALALLVSAVAAYWGTQSYGLVGAAWSVVATQLVLSMCYLAVYLRRLSPTGEV